jgi:dienelactone hydrolase
MLGHVITVALAVCTLLVGVASAQLALTVEERTLVDVSRPTPPNGAFPGAPDRTLRTLFWIPTGACGGSDPCPPYPLLVIAHGYGGTPEAYDAFARTIAEAGYVVAAPEFPLSGASAPSGPTIADLGDQPGDLAFVVAEALMANANAADTLFALIEPTSLATLGHSLGGSTAQAFAHNSCCNTVALGAAVLVATSPTLVGVFPGSLVDTGPPTLVLHGTADLTVPFSGAPTILALSPTPRLLVGVDGSGHGALITTSTEPANPERAAGELATLSFLDSLFRSDTAGLDAALLTLEAQDHIVVEEQCDALVEVCPEACTVLEATDPPTDPPDQSPRKASITVGKLDKFLGAQKLKAKGFFNPATGAPVIAPDLDGVHVRLTDAVGTGYDANIPGGAAGSSVCGTRDGWSTKLSGSGVTTWTYRNRSGAVPPLCATGSAKGISSIRIKDLRSTGKQALQYSLNAKSTVVAIDTSSPLTLLSFDLVTRSQTALGEPSTAALAGACARNEFSGAPIPATAPTPFCKTSPAAGTVKTVKCKGQ